VAELGRLESILMTTPPTLQKIDTVEVCARVSRAWEVEAATYLTDPFRCPCNDNTRRRGDPLGRSTRECRRELDLTWWRSPVELSP